MSDIKIKPSDGVIGSTTGRPRKYPLDQMKVNEEFETGPILYQTIWSSIRNFRRSVCGDPPSKSCPVFVITRLTPDDSENKANFKVTRTK